MQEVIWDRISNSPHTATSMYAAAYPRTGGRCWVSPAARRREPLQGAVGQGGIGQDRHTGAEGFQGGGTPLQGAPGWNPRGRSESREAGRWLLPYWIGAAAGYTETSGSDDIVMGNLPNY